MGEWVSQWDAFYRLCDRYDQELLCGKQDMQLNDYERLTYLSFAFGYIEVLQELLERYPDLTEESLTRFDRMTEVQREYPDDMQEVALGETYEQWIQDFLNRMPEEKRACFRKWLEETS